MLNKNTALIRNVRRVYTIIMHIFSQIVSVCFGIEDQKILGKLICLDAFTVITQKRKR